MTTLREDLQAAVEALEPIAQDSPGVDAPCHYGIVTQEKCVNCNRIKAARIALSRLRARLEQVDAEPVAILKRGKFAVGGTYWDVAVLDTTLSDGTPLYTSPTPAAAPEFDSAPQVSRNPQTGIKPAAPAVDVEKLPELPDPKWIYHPPVEEDEPGSDELFLFATHGAADAECPHCERLYTDAQMQAYARAALRMHLTGGK